MTNLTSFFSLTRKFIAKRAESRSFLTFCAVLVEKCADNDLRGEGIKAFSRSKLKTYCSYLASRNY